MVKKLFALAIGFILVVSVLSVQAAESAIAVEINDMPVAFSQPPIMRDDRILVPIRALAETMKFDVDWDGNSQIVTIADMSKTLKLRIGVDVVNKVYKYGSREENIKIDVPAAIYENSTYVPLRAVAELFGAEVVWESKTQTAKIEYLNTYGDIITFEDEGIEKLCRLAVTLGYPDNFYDIFQDFNYKDYHAIYNKDISLYDGPFYEGMALQIQSFGYYGFEIPKWINIESVEDIKNFPNVNSLYLCQQNIHDISALRYNKTYYYIDLTHNPISDFNVLNQITVEKHIEVSIEFPITNWLCTYDIDYEDKYYTDYPSYAKEISDICNRLHQIIADTISNDMNDYEKAKAIHDWIISNAEYDYDSYNDPNNAAPNTHSILGIIFDGKAVCAGYASTYNALCGMVGLECTYVIGEAGGGSHGWNIVKVDGNYYHVDTTWDDTGGGESDEYFLKSDEFMQRNHLWEADEYPACPKSYGE